MEAGVFRLVVIRFILPLINHVALVNQKTDYSGVYAGESVMI
jgi:hypothetical protein